MFDEYIPPYVIADYDGLKGGDSVLHTNYRQDRAIQLSMAFVDPLYPGNLKAKPKVFYAGLTRYYDEFKNYILGAMGSSGGMLFRGLHEIERHGTIVSRAVRDDHAGAGLGRECWR